MLVSLSGAASMVQTDYLVEQGFAGGKRAYVGAVPENGVADMGTAQAATSSTIQIRAAANFADNSLTGFTVSAFGSTQGYWQTRVINSNVNATDTITVDSWSVTPTGTITYIIYMTAPASLGNAFPVNAIQINSSAGAAVALANMLTGVAGTVITASLSGSVATVTDKDGYGVTKIAGHTLTDSGTGGQAIGST